MTSKSLVVNCFPDLEHEHCDPYMILKHSSRVKDTFVDLWCLKRKCQIYYRDLGAAKRVNSHSSLSCGRSALIFMS